MDTAKQKMRNAMGNQIDSLLYTKSAKAKKIENDTKTPDGRSAVKPFCEAVTADDCCKVGLATLFAYAAHYVHTFSPSLYGARSFATCAFSYLPDPSPPLPIHHTSDSPRPRHTPTHHPLTLFLPPLLASISPPSLLHLCRK
jgi:hypothetical protein